MKRMTLGKRIQLGLVLTGWSLAVWAGVATPESVISTTADEVVHTLKTDKDIKNGDSAKAYALIRDKVLPHFDFMRMTRLAMGKYWRDANADQQQKLADGFRDLLVRTYSSSLTAFTNQTVEFRPLSMKPDDTDVTVHSEIRQPGGQPIPIDYSMYKTSFGWKVYDVSIDGVSLVTNYRSSFSSTIRQNGIDGLIKTLASQSAHVPAKPAPRPGS